jgi:hypothetical protein
VIAERMIAGELLDERSLIDFVRSRRWFGSKTEEVARASVVDGVVVRSQPPMLVTAVTEIRFHTGTHELYQLLLGVRPRDDDPPGDVIEATEDWIVYPWEPHPGRD